MGIRERLPLWHFNWYWSVWATLGRKGQNEALSKFINTIFGPSNTWTFVMVFKESEVEFQVLPLPLKTNWTGDLVLPGYKLTWIFKTSDQYHHAKPKSSCSVVIIKHELFAKFSFIFTYGWFLSLFTYLVVNLTIKLV